MHPAATRLVARLAESTVQPKGGMDQPIAAASISTRARVGHHATAGHPPPSA